MPAGFNKGQIEYIKTIANVNGHKSYARTTQATQDHTPITGNAPLCDDHCRYTAWVLGNRPLMRGTGAQDGTTDVAEDTTFQTLDVYDVPINQDQKDADPSERVTPECFLESVNLKLRHIIPLDYNAAGMNDDQKWAALQNTHKEFRLIVFRHKEKQHASAQLAENFSNPLYDMLHGASGYKWGPKGYRQLVDHEGNINYKAHTGYKQHRDRDRLLTDPVNTDDYVVMKDCRYYLGKEYGGKHIYEDQFFWNHEDPIATDQDDLTYNDSNKNYAWYIFILGVNNSAAAPIDSLGYFTFSGNTFVTSG